MHKLNWNDLKYFVEVVHSGNVSEAGYRLGVNQSTVSRRIANLENALGKKSLFDRTAKGWVITPVGEMIVKLAEEMEIQANNIHRKIESDSEDVSGLIKVTVSDVCAKRFVLPVIRDFKRDYPDVDFELIAAEEVLNLAGREADIAIQAIMEPPPNVVGKRICRLEDGVKSCNQAFIAKHYQAAIHPSAVIRKNSVGGGYWPDRAKEDARLLAEKLPFAELRDGKFRQHPQRPVVTVSKCPKQ